jgi:hypothetical protein
LLVLLVGTPALVRATAAAPAQNAAYASWVARIAPALPPAGPHFLYIDDGGVFQSSLSGYRLTATAGLVPTPGSPYPTDGKEGFNPIGLNYIATSAAHGPCLFHTEQQITGTLGQVGSFRVDPTTGVLTEVSILALPGAHSPAGDVQVAADGREVYAAQWPSLAGHFYLDALTMGAGCTLTLATHFLAPGSVYSIALVGQDGLLAVDDDGARLDMYHITNGTELTLVSSTPSQVIGPLGAASGQVGGQAYIFNGIGSAYHASEGEAHTVDGQGQLAPVPGSPAADHAGQGGPWVWFDPLHQQVIQSEAFSGALVIFGAKGDTFTLLSHTAPVLEGTGPMAQLGSVLFVGNYAINACMLAAGAATCYLALQLPHPGGTGISVL